ncbi:MAG: lysylphosphatidylglycerol synthase domain-containing protein [Phycisphaerales bacterium]
MPRTRATSSPSNPPTLHAPEGPLALLERPRRFTPLRLLIQILGFALGLALLAWCASLAFSPDTRAELQRLRDADASLIASLFLLTVLSAAINGFAFWITSRPLHPLRLPDVVAVNTLASFLAYLPFKLGALVRVAIHRKRDHMLFRDLIAWLAAFSALSLATFLPLIAATLIHPNIDLLWALLALLGIAICLTLGVLLSRRARTTPWLARLSLGAWRIAQHPRTAAALSLAKVADIAVHAARFAIAAHIFGAPLPAARAALYAIAYFLIGSVSPVGMLGLREAGIVFLPADVSAETMARLVLTLSAIEALALGALAPLTILYLGPRSLLSRRPSPTTPPDAPSTSTSAPAATSDRPASTPS